jgi:hypothetical protein
MDGVARTMASQDGGEPEKYPKRSSSRVSFGNFFEDFLDAHCAV